jgi:hypothetical protein
MTDRPTPEQIADEIDAVYGESADMPGTVTLVELREAGFVIVHPDDFPSAETMERARYVDPRKQAYADGLRDGIIESRKHIFGETP